MPIARGDIAGTNSITEACSTQIRSISMVLTQQVSELLHPAGGLLLSAN